MSHRLWIAVGFLAVVALTPVAGQAPKATSKTAAKTRANSPAVAKTPWGDPDLRGAWTDSTSTPLQPPDALGGKDVLTDAEAAEFQEQLGGNLSRDRRDGDAEADVGRAYNEHGMNARHLKITADRRTSLIVDPPDGRIPPLVPLPPDRVQTKAARAAAAARFHAG